MRKHAFRITTDAAIEHAVLELARKESRPAANMVLVLLKEALAARRAQTRSVAGEQVHE